VDVQIVLHQHDLLRLRKVRVGYSFEENCRSICAQMRAETA
jgi:hypothetical protein